MPKLNMPSSQICGDSLKAIPDEGLIPDPSWYLSVIIAFGKASKLYAANYEGVIFIPIQETQQWPEGEFAWRAYIENGDERITVDAGNISVKPLAPSLMSTTEELTHAEKVVAAIEAILEDPNNVQYQQMVIEGRSIMRWSPTELYQLRDKYRAEVIKDKIKETNGGVIKFGSINMRLGGVK